MAHFNDEKYRGPGASIGKSGEGEVKGSGVDRMGVDKVKSSGDDKDQRGSDYRGPGAKLKTE